MSLVGGSAAATGMRRFPLARSKLHNEGVLFLPSHRSPRPKTTERRQV